MYMQGKYAHGCSMLCCHMQAGENELLSHIPFFISLDQKPSLGIHMLCACMEHTNCNMHDMNQYISMIAWMCTLHVKDKFHKGILHMCSQECCLRCQTPQSWELSRVSWDVPYVNDERRKMTTVKESILYKTL